MGMKIKQESKVKIFFRKIFKLSKKGGKDGGWRHKKLDSSLYGSSDSVLQSWAKAIEENNKRNSQVLCGSTDELVPSDSYECVIKVPIQENKHDSTLDSVGSNTETKKKLKKKLKTKQNSEIQSGLLLEVKENENIDEVDITTKGASKAQNKKKNQKKKNKKSKEIPKDDQELKSGSNSDNQDQDLIDVDLDLVLSSFPNINSKSKSHFEEAGDNRANEQLFSKRVALLESQRQIEVVIEHENLSEKNTKSQKDVEEVEDVCSEGTLLLEEHNNFYQKLSVDCEKQDSEKNEIKISKKKNKKSKKKQNIDEPKEQIPTVNQDFKKSKNDEPKNLSSTANPEVKKSKKTRKNKKNFQLLHNEEEENLDLTDNNNQDHGLEQVDHEVETEFGNDSDLITDETAFSQSGEPIPEPPKKRKKNKKKSKARTPEDDFNEDTFESSRRRRHQEIWEADIITELETPEEPENQPKKKLRRRRWKLKFNKTKKRLGVKQYDELSTHDNAHEVPENDSKMTARNFGRRMWKACKTGWKYLRTGLITYTKTPSINLSFNPMVTRGYSDVFNPEGEGTSQSRYD